MPRARDIISARPGNEPFVSQPPFRIVIDTNTLLRGLVAASSAAARIRRAAERRAFLPLLSKPVMDEYRAVLLDDAMAERFPEIHRECG